MIWGLLIGLAVGAAIGVVVAAFCAAADRGDRLLEYEAAVEELGKALRESYAWIHVSGDWDEFSSSGFTVEPPAPSAIADAERRAIRDARARARHRGDVVPLGHVRLGIDAPVHAGIGHVFTRPVDPRAANPGQEPNEWGELGTTEGGTHEL